MENKRCPQCHCRAELSVKTVRLSTSKWPLAMIGGGLVMGIGGLLSLSAGQVLPFTLLAAVPIFFNIERRCGCAHCGIQFDITR